LMVMKDNDTTRVFGVTCKITDFASQAPLAILPSQTCLRAFENKTSNPIQLNSWSISTELPLTFY
jgi:hypothetical protein